MDLRRQTERDMKKKKLLMFFLTGFTLGVFYIILLGQSENSNMLMSSYFFAKYQYMEYEARDLLVYILKSRFSVLCFLWIMGLTVLGNMAALLFGLWAGFSMGLILTMAVIKLGIAGVLLCVVSMIPQYFVYFPAFVFGLLRICEMGQQRKPSAAYGMAFLVTAALIFVGSMLESYVNPVLLKSLIRKI